MAKKSENENRVIYVTRKAFFALIEAFIFDKITGKDLPDDHTLPENYFSVLDDGVTVNVWERAKEYSPKDMDVIARVFAEIVKKSIGVADQKCSFQILLFAQMRHLSMKTKNLYRTGSGTTVILKSSETSTTPLSC